MRREWELQLKLGLYQERAAGHCEAERERTTTQEIHGLHPTPISGGRRRHEPELGASGAPSRNDGRAQGAPLGARDPDPPAGG